MWCGGYIVVCNFCLMMIVSHWKLKLSFKTGVLSLMYIEQEAFSCISVLLYVFGHIIYHMHY